MRNLLSHRVLSWLLALVPLATVQAQPYEVYVSGNLGLAMPMDSDSTIDTEPDLLMEFDLDHSPLLSAAIGVIENTYYRSEIELSHQSHDLEGLRASGITIAPEDIGLSGEASSLNALINAYFDFDAGTNLTTYLTAGAGVANVDIDSRLQIENDVYTSDDEDTAFAWKLGGGLGLELTENFTIDLGSRYFSAHKLQFESLRTEVRSHNLSAGFRFRF